MDALFQYAAQTKRLMNPAPLAARMVSMLPGLPAVGNASPLSVRNPRLGETIAHAGSILGATAGGAGGGDRLESDFPLWVPPRPVEVRETPPYLDVIGQPSLSIYQEPGTKDTVIELGRYSRYMEWMTDHDAIDRLRLAVLQLYRAMSRGPYSLADLREMNHPYGFDIAPNGAATARKVPSRYRGKSLNHVKGIRGSVPNKTIVNSQSGEFAQSWESQLLVDSKGIRLVWRNTAKSAKGFAYPFALATGTMRNGRPLMQAHGPFTFAVLKYLHQIDAQWRRESIRAWHRKQHDEALAQAMASQVMAVAL